MAHSVMLQDWTSVGGHALVKQPASLMAKVSGYRDAVLYLVVSNLTATIGAPTLAIQTGPSLDDALFQLIDATASFGVAVGSKTVTLNDANVAVPLGRYVRWQLSGSGTWSVTFRIWLTLAS